MLAQLAARWEEERVRRGVSTTRPVPTRVSVPVSFIAPDEGAPLPEFLTWEQVAALWGSRQPILPDEDSLRRQETAARWLAGKPAEQVLRAMWGITQLWPHAPPKGEPWTCADVQRQWDKALQKSEDHPDLKELRFAAALTERINQRNGRAG